MNRIIHFPVCSAVLGAAVNNTCTNFAKFCNQFFHKWYLLISKLDL